MPHYVDAPALTRLFVHRALRAALVAGLLDAEAGSAIERALGAALRDEERLGGSFGPSVLTNAATALTGLLWNLPLRSRALEAWLTERQSPDGSWAAEPLYLVPAEDLRPASWGHAALTTAVVVLALAGLRAT